MSLISYDYLTNRMKYFFQSLILSASVLIAASGSAQQVNYVNEGSQVGRPEIEATTFYNSGLFRVGIPFDDSNDPVFGLILSQIDLPPYSPLGTTHFTNDFSGIMEGDFRFETKTDTDTVQAQHFLNLGTIRSFDSLIISADLIENAGVLNAGSASKLELRGDEIDLTFGKLNASVSSDFQFGGGILSPTNYVSPNGVYENYWGMGTNQLFGAPGNNQGGVVFDHATYADPAAFSTPLHEVLEIEFGFTNFTILPNSPAEDFDVSVNTNVVDGTNSIVQLTFFRTNFPQAIDTNTTLTGGARWVGVNDYASSIVSYEYRSFNNFEDDFTTNYLFIQDDFAVTSATNRFLSVNFVNPTNRRPNTYDVSRDLISAPGLLYSFAQEGNTTYTNTLLINDAYPTTIVSNSFYAAYGFQVAPPEPSLFSIINGTIVPSLPSDPIRHPTNMVGRIIIESDTIDMSNARIRAENYVRIKANKIVGSNPASVDSPRYEISLENEEPMLSVTNVIKNSVSRFNGEVSLHSTLWTNQVTQLSTNVDDTGVETVTTNFADAVFHVFVVDPTFNTDERAEVISMNLSNPNKIVVGDNFSIAEDIVIDSPVLEVHSSITSSVRGAAVDSSVFPSLQDFTLLGSLDFDGALNLGDESPLSSFTMGNGASISVSNFKLGADQINISGQSTISTEFGSFLLSGTDVSITDGTSIFPSGRSVISADSLNIGGLTFDALAQIVGGGFLSPPASFPDIALPVQINVGNFLHDDGVGANILLTGGLTVNGSDVEGDLSFSNIKSLIPKWKPTTHVWPAKDKGASLDGFNNNLALASFDFDMIGFPSRIIVKGSTSGRHALYVQNLILNNAAEANFAEAFQIDDNFVIYFQNLTSPNGLLLPEDVNGAYGGKFIHVPAAVIPQQAGADSVSVATDSSGNLVLSVDAQAGASYVIEKSSDLSSGVWIQVGTLSNDGSSSASISSSPISTDEDNAFFRIRPE